MPEQGEYDFRATHNLQDVDPAAADSLIKEALCKFIESARQNEDPLPHVHLLLTLEEQHILLADRDPVNVAIREAFRTNRNKK